MKPSAPIVSAKRLAASFLKGLDDDGVEVGVPPVMASDGTPVCVGVEPAAAVEVGTPIETETWGQHEFGCLFEKEW